jgi:hypothetical protein
MRKYFAVLPIAGLLLLSAVPPSLAAGHNNHEGQNAEMREQDALANTTITLSQAIATAEQQTGGKAYDAGSDVDTGTPRIVVETNGPKGCKP